MVSDISIDKALFDVAMTNIVSPPAIVRPFFDVRADTDSLLTQWQRHIAEIEKEVANTFTRHQEHSAIVSRALANGEVEPRHIEMLGSLIEKIERSGADTVRDCAANTKELRRIVRRIKAGVPVEQGDRLAALLVRLEQTFESLLDEYSQCALLYRALRAEYDPAARGGRAFDDPQKLQSYLTQLAS